MGLGDAVRISELITDLSHALDVYGNLEVRAATATNPRVTGTIAALFATGAIGEVKEHTLFLDLEDEAE
jgi:hypothetical protein